MGKAEVDKAKITVKTKKEKSLFPTKVVIRRLPPSLTEEQLKEFLGVLPEHDFFYFVDGQLSFGPVTFSRAYINFTNPDDIIKFRDEFDGFVLEDERGHMYPAVVEYAPFQGIPKKKNRKDPKCGTIEQDKDYLAFLQSLEEEVQPLPSIEAHLEELESRKEKIKKKTTPLLEYLKMKRSSRGGSRLAAGKKRHEKDETPKTLKKNTSPSKDSHTQVPREEKYKDGKKSDNRDTGRRDQGRKEEDRKHSKDPQEKDHKHYGNQRERDGKSRPDSSRPNSRTDDRRHGNRRDRRDSDRRDSDRRDSDRRDSDRRDSDMAKGRDERGRRYADRYPDDRRRDNRPSSRKDSRGPFRNESSAKGKDRDTKEESLKPKKDQSKVEKQERRDRGPSSDAQDRASRETESELSKRRESEREKELSKVKNKDRPDKAIYQPRSRSARPDTDQQGKETKESLDKGQEADPKEADPKDRDRDKKEYKDKNRDRNRDRERDRRGDRGRDKERDKDRYRESDRKERDRERDRERERARKKDRDRRDRVRKNDNEVVTNRPESNTSDTTKDTS